MKKRIISAISKLTLVSLFFVTAATVAAHPNVSYPAEKNAEVKYLGTSEDAIVFNVAFDNPGGNKFSVIVLDEDGSQLFQEVYTSKKFDKKFRLPKTDKTKLTFIIRNFKDADLKQTFEINTSFVENVVVTKVN